ncbi:DUF2259 domain-containing protein [Mesorhizobium sp. NBSH29]|uniref:DUF2259 domain-containing protein n=1 Tax=Mesorhizobium sp. NBSH29 TaxID=2654249 RepID=UPI0018965582|nr:DUF2259 domain-containing protein [Mesorhizobium sp. NBSH29]QPC87894.1 DUF2259 domain-containing protein [Mesorhizobium sp. NBSH29]
MTLRNLPLLAALLLLASASITRAGDVATLNVLGFNASGSVFAFEEYGVQDGSGFPYASRTYIDTATDTFLPGSPISVRLDNDGATLEQARAQARATGDALVPESVLLKNSGFTVGSNALTELNADPFRMVVNPRPVFAPVDPPLEFRLEEIPLPPVGGCGSQGDAAGFRLLRVDATQNGQTTVLHEDAKIPLSRHCPNGYRIGGVQTFYDGNTPVYAVLIAVQQYGFEGPNFRWIAVTGRL